MEAKAVARYVRLSPTKARRYVNLIRGKSVGEALSILKFLPGRAATPLFKVVQSAAANAEHNLNLDKDSLYVARCFVDQGPTMKRWQPRMRGQAFPITKRTSHITVVVTEREEK